MYQNFKYDKATEKLNKAIVDNGMNIESIDYIRPVEVANDNNTESKDTSSSYFVRVSVSVLIPVENENIKNGKVTIL